MNIWGIIKRLSIKELLSLCVILLQRPLLVLPTLRATRRTIVICDQLYSKMHHANGKENAFRHALWNILVCKYAFEINGNQQKSIRWSAKITDLHEKLSPNPPLEETMDLHNNKVGRSYFCKLIKSSEEEMITFLVQKTEEAEIITQVEDIIDKEDILVYLL